MTKQREESSHSPSVKCPVCGELNTDLWEYGGGYDLEENGRDIECGWCSAPLRLTARVITTYILTAAEGDAS